MDCNEDKDLFFCEPGFQLLIELWLRRTLQGSELCEASM